ncbi:MAG: helix-destabilizing protein [Inoviridae sp.]|nr:MAG: helix-destabilizing protein [Inoviridae sp.]
MLTIEIDALDGHIQSRTFAGQNGKSDRRVFWQVGYMNNGGRYPVRIEIPMEESQRAYTAGVYSIHPSSFQASKYNKIELNPFSIVLVPQKETKAA